MFTIEKIPAGEPLIVFGGEYVNTKEAKNAKANGKLVMQWGDDLFSIEDRGDDLGYFINHSCDPNAGIKGQILLVAIRDIKPREEITYDYAMSDGFHGDRSVCCCGTKKCRKVITGDDWKKPGLQRRYKGYFSWYIQERINKLKKKYQDCVLKYER